MSEMTRRDLVAAIAALGTLGSAAESRKAGAQETASVGEGTLGKARVFSPEGRLTKTANGAEHWNVMSGTVATGEAIGMHYSATPAGTPAVAPHRIMHTELLAVAEGTLELWADGEVTPAPAGSVIYVAKGTNHFVKNVGEVTARYFVFQVGGDTKKG